MGLPTAVGEFLRNIPVGTLAYIGTHMQAQYMSCKTSPSAVDSSLDRTSSTNYFVIFAIQIGVG